MKIKVENLYKNKDENSKLAGVATIILNDSIKINTIKIVRLNGNLFIAMPSVKIKGEFKDVIHPTTSELRTKIANAVLNAYKYNIFEDGTIEEFHISDIKIYKMNDEKCKAVLRIVFNDNIAIEYSYIIDNGRNSDGSVNIGLSFQVNKDDVPFVSILTEDLREEVLEKTFRAYNSLI